MAKPRNKFADYSLYLLCRCVAMLFHCFPIGLNIQTAKLLGNGLYLVDRKHRNRAMYNLKRSFPDFTEAQCRKLARQHRLLPRGRHE